MVVLLLVILALGMFHLSDPGFLVDDATITYRYAENIAEGRGFVYNENEAIQGTSTPLFTLVLAGLAWLGIVPTQSGQVIAALSGLIAVVVVYLVGRTLAGRMAGAGAALLLATSAHFAANVSSGMETPFYVLLILATFLAFYQERYALAALGSGLCVLTRLDGLAVPATILIVIWARRRTVPWREAGIILATLLPWFVFAVLYFGSPVPSSMVAKQQHIKSAGSFWMIRFLINSPFELLLMPILIFFGTLLSHSNRPAMKTMPITLWLLTYVSAYTASGLDAYDWYNVPPIPILYLLFGVAIAQVAKRIGFAKERNMHLVILALFAFSLAYQVKYDFALIPDFRKQAIAVEGTRVKVGEWLRDNTLSDAVIATDGIGHIGYFSGRYIVDLAGLVTPYAVGKDYIDTLDHFEADYAVSVIKKDERHPFRAEEFLSRYELVREWAGSQEYVGAHVLFRRRTD